MLRATYLALSPVPKSSKSADIDRTERHSSHTYHKVDFVGPSLGKVIQCEVGKSKGGVALAKEGQVNERPFLDRNEEAGAQIRETHE